MVVKQTQEVNYSAERCAGPVRMGQVWADCWDLKDEWGDERKGSVPVRRTRAWWGKRP